MTISEEICVCEGCKNLPGYERLETKVKPYVAFRVESAWKPHNDIKVLFIAESPPWDRNDTQPYFYNNRYPKKVGLRREVRWSFIKLRDDEFCKIVELGEVNEGIVINELLER